MVPLSIRTKKQSVVVYNVHGNYAYIGFSHYKEEQRCINIRYVCVYSLYLVQTLTDNEKNDNTVMYMNSQ